MKQPFVKSVLATATLLASGYMGSAMAHTVSGTVAAGKSDVFNFQCFADTNLSYEGSQSPANADKVYLELTTASGAVTATLGHVDMVTPANQHWTTSNTTAFQVSDTTTGVGGGVTLTPPAGKTAGIWSSYGYNITVTNGTTSSKTYTVTYHCQTTANLHTGTGAWISSGTADPLADYTTVINQ